MVQDAGGELSAISYQLSVFSYQKYKGPQETLIEDA